MEESIIEVRNLLSSEVVCAIITLLGVIFANLTARWTAKEAADREIARQKQAWEHDNEIAFEKAFLDMVEAVSSYILESSITNQKTARVKTAIMLSFTEGKLADKVESLYACLNLRPAPDAEEKLLDVIRSKPDHGTASKGFVKNLFSGFYRAKT